MSGLYLEGANFNRIDKVIEEAPPDSTLMKMPVITLIPVDIKIKNRPKEVQLHSSNYECPLYRSPARFGTLKTTGHSSNFVMYVDIQCNEGTNAKHWIKRGVALLCEPTD